MGRQVTHTEMQSRAKRKCEPLTCALQWTPETHTVKARNNMTWQGFFRNSGFEDFSDDSICYPQQTTTTRAANAMPATALCFREEGSKTGKACKPCKRGGPHHRWISSVLLVTISPLSGPNDSMSEEKVATRVIRACQNDGSPQNTRHLSLSEPSTSLSSLSEGQEGGPKCQQRPNCRSPKAELPNPERKVHSANGHKRAHDDYSRGAQCFHPDFGMWARKTGAHVNAKLTAQRQRHLRANGARKHEGQHALPGRLALHKGHSLLQTHAESRRDDDQIIPQGHSEG